MRVVTDIVEATYENGRLKLDHPLDMPEQTRVTISVHVPKASGTASSLPDAPRTTSEKLREKIRKHGKSGGGLSKDFSRADIYRNHD